MHRTPPTTRPTRTVSQSRSQDSHPVHTRAHPCTHNAKQLCMKTAFSWNWLLSKRRQLLAELKTKCRETLTPSIRCISKDIQVLRCVCIWRVFVSQIVSSCVSLCTQLSISAVAQIRHKLHSTVSACFNG